MSTSVFVLGSVNLDILAYVDEFPVSGQTLSANETIVACGGKGANQAFACGQNYIDTTLLCKIGNDIFGEQVQKMLSERRNVDCKTLTSTTENTTIAQILVRHSDSQNQIVISEGANKAITVDEIRNYQTQIESSQLLMLQLENNFTAIMTAINIANKANVKVLLNPAPYESEVSTILPLVDILTPNETEASQLTGIEVTDAHSAKRAAEKLYQLYGIPEIVITLGSAGALCFQAGKPHFIPAVIVNAIDTSGAGDAFNGALSARLVLGDTLIEAAEYANSYAALAVQVKGASNMPLAPKS
ncbi:MAG: ribokinase [Parashewanella sp.]